MTKSDNRRIRVFNVVQGRRGKTSIADCLLTVLSIRGREASWPAYTFDVLAERVSALRGSVVPIPSVQSVIYRSDLFEPGPKAGGRVTWQLNGVGRHIVQEQTAARHTQ